MTDIILDLATYVRKPFEVDGVQVTDENLEAVSDWCAGEIRTKPASEKYPETRYIKVPVKRPLTHRQTLAYPGDFVFYNGVGFKVYTKDAALSAFELKA